MNSSLLVWLVLCVIWSSTWVFIKLGLRDLPPVTFAGLRFLVAAAILWLIVFIRRRPVPRDRRNWALLAWTGLIAFALNYGLIFWGEQRITSGLAAVLQALIPVFGLIFAHYHLPAERITLRKILGAGLGLAGVGLIFYDQMQLESVAALHGSAALIGSSICVAYANVLVKARLQHLDPATLAAGQMLCGFVPLLVVGALWEGNPLALRWTPQAWLALIYLALIGSAVAFLLYYWLVRRVAVTKTMLIALVTPVLALLIGKLTFDERITWRIAAGSVAILAGIALIIVQRRSPEG